MAAELLETMGLSEEWRTVGGLSADASDASDAILKLQLEGEGAPESASPQVVHALRLAQAALRTQMRRAETAEASSGGDADAAALRRELAELRASEAAGWTAIHDTDGGRLGLLACLTWLVLFPLSLAGLGEMDVVSIFGAVMVVILSGYTVYVAAASGHGISPSEIELKWSTLPESLSELGFAFWLQARSEFGAIRRNSAQFSDALLPPIRSRACCRCCASSPRARSASAS